MDRNILELVYTYNESNRIIDDEFFVRMFYIFKNGELKDYLNNLIIIDEKNMDDEKYKVYTEGFAGLFGQAAYDTERNNLVIYSINIKYSKERIIDELKISKNDRVTFYNLLILQTIFHELEHANQKRNKSEGNDWESEMLRAVSSSGPETTMSYEYSLEERLAEIKSYEQVLELMKELGIGNQIIYDFFNDRLQEIYRSGYHFRDENGYLVSEDKGRFVSPTQKYVELRNCDKEKYLSLIEGVSFEERIKYGLPVDLEEYKKYGKNESYHL